jgi:hypothetical protein
MSANFSSKLHGWFRQSLWLTVTALVVVSIIAGTVLMASVLLGVGLLVLLLAAAGTMFSRSGRRVTGYRFDRAAARQNHVLEGDYTVVTRERKTRSWSEAGSNNKG